MLLPTFLHNAIDVTLSSRSERESSHQGLTIILTLLIMCSGILTLSAQQELNIDRWNEGEEIPISLSGFPSESLAILRFDLEIQGFEIVEKDQASYSLLGIQGGRL